MTTKTIRIPLIIDADGRWGAFGRTGLESGREADWYAMEEDAANYRPLVCPQRMWVTVEVPLPVVGELTGRVEAE